MTPAELIEKALREHMRIRLGERAFKDLVLTRAIVLSGAEVEDAARIAVDALAGAGLVVVSAELLESLTDPDPCWFDQNGGCQAHGWLSLKPGEHCSHQVARELLAALPERAPDA